MIKHRQLTTILLMALVLLGTLGADHTAAAVEPIIGDTVRLNDQAPHQGALVLSGNNVVLQQPVNGSVWILANTVSVESDISGSLTVVSRDLSISGSVQGDLAALALRADVKGEVGGTTSIAATRFTSEGTLGTLFAAVLNTELFGSVGSAWLLSNQVMVDGQIDDAHVRSSITSIGSESRINQFEQVSRVAPIVLEGAEITTLNHRVAPFSAFGRYTGWQAYVAWFISNLLWLLTGALFLWRYARPFTLKLSQAIRRGVFSSSLSGLFYSMMAVVLAFGFMGTRVGIHVAVLALIILIIAGHLSFWLFSVAIGGLLGKLLWREQKLSLASVLVGATVVAALLVVPLLGSALIIVVSILGIGTLTRSLSRAKLPTPTP